VAEPLDDSTVAELADTILVALGLRVAALVLYPPRADGRTRMLVLADDLPGPAERDLFLANRTPTASLADADIVLKTPAEFAAEPASDYVELVNGRFLLDRQGIVGSRLRRLGASPTS
jgi:hypothetical protein